MVGASVVVMATTCPGRLATLLRVACGGAAPAAAPACRRARMGQRCSGGEVAAGDGRVAELRVLGSISIDVDGRPVPVGGEKPRRLLAMLVAHRNAVVSAERLTEVLWADEVPESGMATLQSYVSRLRRLLPPSAQIVGQPPGYRLAVPPGATDVDRFEAALAAGL